MTSGRPNAAACATKLRLPRVPPGARFGEKIADSSPYACSSDVTAARTTASATVFTNALSRSATGRPRAVQYKTSADPLNATALAASHGFVAKLADKTPRTRYPPSARSIQLPFERRTAGMAKSPASSAVR